jgi:antirestriction protein ArdC
MLSMRHFSFTKKQKTIMDTKTEAPAQAGEQKDVYAIINERIIEELSNGTVPWQKPWSDGGLPQNLITKRHYRGINIMLLALGGYEHNLFLTFRQVNQIGGKVRKGEKGHLITYWNSVEDTMQQQASGDSPERSKKRLVLRYYYVYNILQCENIPAQLLPKENDIREIPTCESVVKNMPNCPAIKFQKQQAFYSPAEDYINMPKRKSFKSDESYYSTLFHEMVHSTGHPKRLNREGITQAAEFGGELYSLEELVAEIGTCYLQSVTNIADKEFKQSAGYIGGWLEKLKSDRRFIFSAFSAAQKAVDYILNVKDAKEDAQQQDS